MSTQKLLCFIYLLSLSFPGLAQNKRDTTDRVKFVEPNFKASEFKKPLFVSGALIGLGLIAYSENEIFSNEEFAEERNEHIPQFHTRIDNYLQYAPIFAVYGLNIAGVKGKNNFGNRTALLLKSELLTGVIVWTLKYTTGEQRPDESNNKSFPSGHTALAFSAATFMSKEYGDLNPWYSIGAYAAAVTVGALRIMNNKHFLSDVLVGAGIGILSTNLVYATHKYRWGSTNISVQIAPIYDHGKLGFYGQLLF